MRIVLALLIAVSVARADEPGERVAFQSGLPDSLLIYSAFPGRTLWQSGPSDPVEAKFSRLLFRGRASTPFLRFEASIGRAGTWGPWTRAEVERFKKSGTLWGQFDLSGEPGDLVRLRVVNESGLGKRTFQIFSLAAVEVEREAGASIENEPVTAPPVVSTAGKPIVLSREDWEASKPTEGYLPMTPAMITIHHTQAAQPMDLDDAKEEMRAIQHFHQKGRGWIDIGYHFVIDGAGDVFQGRPETVKGSHVKGKNDGNVGISLMGDFSRGKPTDAQIEKAVALARWLLAAYGINPNAIKGHRDQEKTDCPGKNLYILLPKIKKAVKAPSPLLAKPPKIFKLRALEAVDGQNAAALFDSRGAR